MLRNKINLGSEDVDMAKQVPEWVRVDRTIDEARNRLEQSSTEEQFQAIGLLCREALISLAQIVYDPTVHTSSDDVTPSRTDAKRMLEAYIGCELGGRANEAARRHAKAVLDLANELQHKRTASFRDAAFCVEATSAVVNLVALISERGEKSSGSGFNVDFSYTGIEYRSEEHLYLLEVTLVNRSGQAIKDYKLEFTFPDLDSIPQTWIVHSNKPKSGSPLVEVTPTDSAVSISREKYAVRVAYRSKDILFPDDRLHLGGAIGLKYRINNSVYANLEGTPPVRWVLYADKIQPKRGEISLAELNNY